MLSINEEFYSIQGEGLHTGTPMYFVRLQGCSVGCYFCDTKLTWKPKEANVEEIDIVKRADEHYAKWICITGGEPYEQPLTQLVTYAHSRGIKTHVETSGGVEFQTLEFLDWLTLSPKDLFSKDHLCKSEFKERANEIKCVVTKKSDIMYYIENFYHYCRADKPLIFQPVDNKQELIKPILEHATMWPYCKVMLQTHKFMGLR